MRGRARQGRGKGGGPRVATYVLLMGLLGLLAASPVPWSVVEPIGLVGLLEGMAIALALTAAGLLVGRSRPGSGSPWARRPEAVWIAAAVGATAVLELSYAGLLSLSLEAGGDPSPGGGGGLGPRWIAARSFLALGILSAWIVRRSTANGGGSETPSWFRTAVLAGACTVALAAAVLTGGTVPAFPHLASGPVSRPWEALPAALFLLGTCLWIAGGGWRWEPFQHWLIVALIANTFLHGGLLLHGPAPGAAAPLMASLLKGLGYGGILLGVLAGPSMARGRTLEAPSDAWGKGRPGTGEDEGATATGGPAGGALAPDFEEHTHDLIQVSDDQGRILHANAAWCRALGYDEREVGRLDLPSLAHPLARETLRSALARARGGEVVRDLRLVLRDRDGESVAVTGTLRPRTRKGGVVEIQGIFRDITQETRLERELARSQANLGALFESTGDAIWSVDTDHRLVTFNSAFSLTVEALTGRAPREGDAVDEVVAPWEVPWFRSCYERALAGHRFSATRREKLDGEFRTYELYFHPFETPDGPGGVVVFSKDVTRRKQVEEALRSAKREAEEANRAKSQFMANMSHELRTPLNSVIGFANLLLKKDPGDEFGDREREFANRILVNGKHLLDLINQLLDLAKIEAGKMEVEVEEIRVQELIDAVLRQLGSQATGRPVELRYEGRDDLRPILADAGKLRQVLINLVGNALKFTEEGEVVVEVEADPETREPRRIHVRDTGVGIPQDRLHSIFEAFSQADAGTARRFGGTGLGLAISSSLCALMGYGISVESREGEGSTFSIQLEREGEAPSVRSSAAGRQRASQPPPSPRWASAPTPSSALEGRRVMVVHDDVDERRFLTDYLGEIGCDVIPSGTGREALETARSARPEVITTQLLMEGMSGWELLEGLRAEPDLSEIPVVMVALLADSEEAEGPPGALDILQKPVDREELLAAVRRNAVKRSGKVLVVDDDEDMRLLLEGHLQNEGWSVHAVENGESALAFLGREDVDLILLDLMMPVMDGFTTLQQLRSAGSAPAVPVVVVTGMELTVEERERLRRPVRKGATFRDAKSAERLREVLMRHLAVS